MFQLLFATGNILKTLLMLALWLLLVSNSHAQPVQYKTPSLLHQAELNTKSDALALLHQEQFHQQLKELAAQLPVSQLTSDNMFTRAALLSALGRHKQLLEQLKQHPNAISYTHYRLNSEAMLDNEASSDGELQSQLSEQLQTSIPKLSNEDLYQLQRAMGWSVERALDYAFNVFKRYLKLTELNEEQAVDLITNAHLYRVLERVIPVTRKFIEQENQQRYVIQPEVLFTAPDGTELTLTIVQPKTSNTKRPTAMQFTIYADENYHVITAVHAAAHGYVGIVANTRGKRLSSNEIIPWEHEGKDATQVIEWIAKQPWSNGDVVMYGGSYNGFTQWATAKYMPTALKAMAPYAAASLITGLPYENNVVLTGNYEWAFHVTNNKTMDNTVYADWEKRNNLLSSFYTSGRPIAEIDKLDGKPNPWFQKWLKHPSFDKYYQSMVPYQQEYARINIPVLTVTGYFDGGQISAVDYLQRHYKYNKNADHSLLIGPYTHMSAQGKVPTAHGNYQLDPVALQKDTEEVVFAWFDHLLFNKPKPALLQDKVNYQLMDSNQWRHSSSFAQLNAQAVTYFLSSAPDETGNYSLVSKPEASPASVSQTVDMSDRSTQHNREPWPVIQDKISDPNGLVFMTAPFTEVQELAGSITGSFMISVNKKDVDIGYNFYAIDKDGKAFHLNTYRSRASYADDMSQRKLLTPYTKTRIPIVNARMTAKLLKPGERLAIVLNVNKNQDAQVNHGSGKDVNFESIEDAGEPLVLHWHNDSEINIPIKPWKESK